MAFCEILVGELLFPVVWAGFYIFAKLLQKNLSSLVIIHKKLLVHTCNNDMINEMRLLFLQQLNNPISN